jgi:hypothetical protein
MLALSETAKFSLFVIGIEASPESPHGMHKPKNFAKIRVSGPQPLPNLPTWL